MKKIVITVMVALTTHVVNAQDIPDIKLSYSAGQVSVACSRAMDKLNARREQIILGTGLTKSPLLEFDEALTQFKDEVGPLWLQAYVANDATIKDEGAVCYEKKENAILNFTADFALYGAIRTSQLATPLERRLLAVVEQNFLKNGAALSASKYAEFRDQKRKIVLAEQQFARNIATAKSLRAIFVPEIKLAGAEASYISSLPIDANGNRIVKASSKASTQILTLVTDAGTRRQYLKLIQSLGNPENVSVLKNLADLRQNVATISGFQTWAEYQIHGRMAKKPETVQNFSDQLRPELVNFSLADMAQLLQLKRLEKPLATKVFEEDLAYYRRKFRLKEFNFDNEKIREFLPYSLVRDGILKIYARLFSLEFNRLNNPSVWSSDVEAYEVKSTRDGRTIGYLLLDLNFRASKSSAFAFTSPVRSAHHGADGKMNKPISAIVANFPAPVDGHESLLYHSTVGFFMHEMGHAMHELLSTVPYGTISGVSVPIDFVESIGGIFENWIWDKGMLNLISGHYLDRTQKMPVSMMDGLISSNKYTTSVEKVNDFIRSQYDLKANSVNGTFDLVDYYFDLRKEVQGAPPVEGTFAVGTDEFILGDYSAGFYSYLWAFEKSDLMFRRFNGNLLDSATAERLEDLVLKNGNSFDSLDMVNDFLKP